MTVETREAAGLDPGFDRARSTSMAIDADQSSASLSARPVRRRRRPRPGPGPARRSAMRSSTPSIPTDRRIERRVDLQRRPGDRHVGHRRRHLDERLDPAERLGEREQRVPSAIAIARSAADRPSPGRRHERDHPAEPRIADRRRRPRAPADSATAARVGLVALDPEVERPQAAQDEEAIQRSRAPRPSRSGGSAAARRRRRPT